MRPIRDIFRSYAVFDENGRHINGTDKQSNHSYGDAYDKLFSRYDWSSNLCPPTNDGRRSCSKCSSDTSHRLTCPDFSQKRESIREDIKLMMEVGVADGSCLLAWREVFPNATIVGMDINPSEKAHGDRIEFHLGDQRSKHCCERVANGRLFDVIIEDATHYLPDTLLTFFWLWPFVRPGGMYIVEEWENVTSDIERIRAMWPGVEIIGTCGKNMQDEPLVVFRKPL